jgi:hypothetical protein
VTDTEVAAEATGPEPTSESGLTDAAPS